MPLKPPLSSPGTGGSYKVPADAHSAKLNDIAMVFYAGLFCPCANWEDLNSPGDDPRKSWLRDIVAKRFGLKR